jgi:hypothetical protein
MCHRVPLRHQYALRGSGCGLSVADENGGKNAEGLMDAPFSSAGQPPKTHQDL